MLIGREPWSSGYGSDQEVVGSNLSAIYWMELRFFHIDLL